MIVLGIVLGVLLIVLIWYTATYNSIKVSKLKVKESLSGIDVALQNVSTH